jgi:hypothetical protein
MTPRARRLCTALAGVPLLLGVAACSSDSETPSGAEPSQTTDSPGASATPLTAEDFVPRLVAAQGKAGTAHIEGSITAGSAGRIELDGDLRLDGANRGARMTLSMAMLGQGVEAILLGDELFVKIPGMSSSRPWLKLDPSSGPFASSGLGALNLGSMLEAMEGALSIKAEGQESVDGVETTRYSVTVDAAKALSAQGLGSLGSSTGKSKTIVYELWVDNDDLVRKLVMDTKSFSMQVQLSDYGSPVTIEAPPASQIGTSPF